mmetsp:Transcript_17700/g.26813  ORF Transcript_17700/g.26813 Transcript_17700/m.26813 type:complete len:134 (-) Transcript_17700:160-561(-)
MMTCLDEEGAYFVGVTVVNLLAAAACAYSAAVVNLLAAAAFVDAAVVNSQVAVYAERSFEEHAEEGEKEKERAVVPMRVVGGVLVAATCLLVGVLLFPVLFPFSVCHDFQFFAVVLVGLGSSLDDADALNSLS